MVRATKKNDNNVGPINPETEERNRLKKLAFSKPNNTLSDKPPSKSDYLPLYPSKTVVKHHGKDILKKSQRKNRFLFSFPGLLAPITGGRIGELKDLGTKNPILYLNFPQGQMKLFGTIVYPKNRYLTLQFSRGGKNVMCEDCFDTMIVFCDAWWIGKKEENPDEARLEFPKELNEGQPVEYDFKGGAGGISEIKQGGIKAVQKHIEEESPKSVSDDDLSNGENISSDLTKATPARQSARTAGKRFNFADQSPSSSVDCDVDSSEDEIKVDTDMGKNDALFSAVHDVDNEDNEVKTPPTGKNPVSTFSVTKIKKTSHTAAQVIKSEEKSGRTHSSLVQSTISTLFKKAKEKKTPTDSRKSQSRVSGNKLEHGNSKRKADQAASPRKKSKVNEEPKVGAENSARKKQSEDEDDIEDFSSSSQDDTVESDEDWAA